MKKDVGKQKFHKQIFNVSRFTLSLLNFMLCIFFSGKMLTQLDVSQNSLTSVPSPAYKNLNHLLILNMNHNKINSIHARAFEGLDTLEILTLYENKINNVDPEAFVGLEK